MDKLYTNKNIQRADGTIVLVVLVVDGTIVLVVDGTIVLVVDELSADGRIKTHPYNEHTHYTRM